MDRKVFYAVISFLCIAGLVVGYFSIPNYDEVSLIYLEEGDFATANERLNEVFDVDEENVSVIMPLVYLHLQHADLNQAVETLEKAVKRNPKSKDMWQAMTKLYKETDRLHDYVRALHEYYQLSPSHELAHLITSYYYILGDEEKRLEVLTDIYKKYTPTVTELIGYASLIARQNDQQGIFELLKRVLDHPDYLNKTTYDALFFARLALNFEHPDVAKQLASRYLKKNNSVEAVSQFAHLMLDFGLQEQVQSLIAFLPESSKDDPEVFDLYYSVFVKKEAYEDAYTYLKELAFQQKLPEKLFEPFFSFVSHFEESAEVKVKLFRLYSLKTLSQENLMNLFMGLEKNQREEVLAEINRNLGEAYLTEHMVFKYVIDLKLPPDYTILKDNEKLFLARIYDQRGMGDSSKKLIQNIDHFENVVGSQLPELARLVIKFQLAEWALPKFEQLRQQHSFPAAEGAWAMIQLDLGEKEKVVQWLEGAAEVPPDILRQVHDVAVTQNMAVFGAEVAGRIVEAKKSPENLALYGAALARIGRDQKALNLFNQIPKRSWEVQQQYLITLALIGKRAQEQQHLLSTKVDQLWEQDALTASQWRGVGYAMIQDDVKESAEKVFTLLAMSDQGLEEDVEAVIGLWGGDISESQMTWLKKRSENLETLEEFQQYQEYAELTGDKEFELNLSLQTLDKYPSDFKTLRRVGIIYLSKGSYSYAYPYLLEAINLDEDDYLLLYQFAETLRGMQCYALSNSYYWKALRSISLHKNPDQYAKSLEASAWYRLGYQYYAVSLYQKLIPESDDYLKLDLANIFLDLNLYCEAARMMQEIADDTALTYKLIQARYFKQRSRFRWAERTLCGLEEGQLLFAGKADLALTLGQKRKATDYLCAAYQEEPLNEEYPRAIRGIWLDNALSTKLFWEHKTSRHNGIEKFTRLLLTKPLIYPHTAFQFFAEWDSIDLSNILDTDSGLAIPFKGDRYRFTAEVKHAFCNGVDSRGFIVYSPQNFGGGAFFNLMDYSGSTTLYFHYNKPEWELFQTLVDQGTSDRVELIRSVWINYRLSLLLRGVYNRYNLEILPDAASSSLVDATVSWELLLPNQRLGKLLFGKDAQLTADYTFEFEESINQKGITDLFGNVFYPISIEDRAVHRATLYFQKLLNPFYTFRCFRGWTYNQKTGGRAKPNYGFELVASIPEKMELYTEYEFLSSDGSETLSSDTTRYRINFVYFY